MITSKEWNTIMTFTGYGNTERGAYTYTTKPDLSGSAYKGTADTYDLTKNIYDLAGNVFEWTLTASDTGNRVYRGGAWVIDLDIYSASHTYSSFPIENSSMTGSRLALYIR